MVTVDYTAENADKKRVNPLPVVCCLFLLFFQIFFSFRNTIRVSNSLDPNQARQNVGPDLGPNCLQMLSGDETSRQRVLVLLTRDLGAIRYNIHMMG